MSKVQASAETRDITLVEAVNMALHRAMADDDNVVVLGEDIATNGGVFRATVGLKEAFGFKRVMDTPLAENLIAGTAIGMATQGLRPVAEFQFMGFIYAGMEQVISHAARMRNRTRGGCIARWYSAHHSGAASMPPNTIPKALKRCLPTFQGCG